MYEFRWKSNYNEWFFDLLMGCRKNIIWRQDLFFQQSTFAIFFPCKFPMNHANKQKSNYKHVSQNSATNIWMLKIKEKTWKNLNQKNVAWHYRHSNHGLFVDWGVATFFFKFPFCHLHTLPILPIFQFPSQDVLHLILGLVIQMKNPGFQHTNFAHCHHWLKDFVLELGNVMEHQATKYKTNLNSHKTIW
jgi:hypothetical protein